MSLQPSPSTFDYVARDSAGARRKGRLTATSEPDLDRQLREQGLYPISVRPAAAPSAARRWRLRPPGDGPLTRRQQVELLSRLSKLASGRVPLDRALALMARGEGPIPACAKRMRDRMREGETFLHALTVDGGIDDPPTLALVRGAEVSGDLAGGLSVAADIQERRLAAIRKMVTALIYPALLLVVAMGALMLILGGIIPQFRPLVADRMDMVPLLGRGVFALSALMSGSWPLLLAGALGAGFGGWLMHRRGKLMPALRRATARLPVMRDVIARTQIALALDVMAALLARNVVLSDALAVVVETAQPGPVRTGLADAARAVSAGQPLSDALTAQGVGSAEVAEMIRIGEETGDIPQMIDRAARDMRDASDRATERLLALFQPALIIFVGLAIGVCLYALFSAITAVNQVAF